MGGGGGISLLFPNRSVVLYDPFDFDQQKKDEEDKANSLT